MPPALKRIEGTAPGYKLMLSTTTSLTCEPEGRPSDRDNAQTRIQQKKRGVGAVRSTTRRGLSVTSSARRPPTCIWPSLGHSASLRSYLQLHVLSVFDDLARCFLRRYSAECTCINTHTHTHTQQSHMQHITLQVHTCIQTCTHSCPPTSHSQPTKHI